MTEDRFIEGPLHGAGGHSVSVYERKEPNAKWYVTKCSCGYEQKSVFFSAASMQAQAHLKRMQGL